MAIVSAGDHAARRFLEFFAATIRNKNTRRAYYRAACNFFGWLEEHRIVELVDIEPIHVAAYVETLQATAAKPTVKQHLAAIACYLTGLSSVRFSQPTWGMPSAARSMS